MIALFCGLVVQVLVKDKGPIPHVNETIDP